MEILINLCSSSLCINLACLAEKSTAHAWAGRERVFTTTPGRESGGCTVLWHILLCSLKEFYAGCKVWQQSEMNIRPSCARRLFCKLQNGQDLRMVAEWWSQDGAFLPTPSYHSPLHFCPYIWSTPVLVHFDLSTPESQHVVAKQSGVASFSVLPRKNMFHDNLSFRRFRTGSVI